MGAVKDTLGVLRWMDVVADGLVHATPEVATPLSGAFSIRPRYSADGTHAHPAYVELVEANLTV